MRTDNLVALLWLAICTAGCESTVDLDAESAGLRLTDLEWAAVASEGTDIEKVVGYWSDDAKVYPPGMPIVEGKAAIREFVAGGFNTPGFSVSWEPDEVVVSPDSRTGYTTGLNRFTAPNSDGNLVTTVGRYVTIWRKEDDGSWKCVIDIWNSGPMP